MLYWFKCIIISLSNLVKLVYVLVRKNKKCMAQTSIQVIKIASNLGIIDEDWIMSSVQLQSFLSAMKLLSKQLFQYL